MILLIFSLFFGKGAHFKKMDINGDGVLTFDELKAALSKQKDFKEQDIKNLMISMDTDGNGTVDYTGLLMNFYLFLLKDGF